MPIVGLKRIKEAAEKLNVNLDVVKLKDLRYGVEVELEHCKYKRLDVTRCNLIKTMKIALAHMQEYPDYYLRLRKMELKAEKYWKSRVIPSVFKK